MENFKKQQVDIEELYKNFEGLIVRAGSRPEFARVLGLEDAIQEAGLAFVETVRYLENSPQGIQMDVLPGYLKKAIYSRLYRLTAREKFIQRVEFSEEYVRPVPSFENSYVEDKEREGRLNVLHEFLKNPKLMLEKAGVSLQESLVIVKMFKENLTEEQVAEGMGCTQPYINRLKKKALTKLKHYLLLH